MTARAPQVILAGEGMPVRCHMTFRCPCGGEAALCLEPPAVLHRVPWCSEFQRLEPDEYLAWVRRDRSKGLPS